MTFMLTAARRMVSLGLCTAAILTVPLGTSPAGAVTAGVDLYITVTSSEGSAYSTRLTCDPDRGAHSQPVAACDALRQVDGRISDLDVDPGPCPLVYAPVQVSVHGHWYGQRVAHYEEFSNSCAMERKLGPVV
ncbi:SSI family serine proteinase inhibitor [Nonomuraea sp. H19]|uniref:SSI family serine proteinase inhibitor n=1 Tax=Nonomuraea sp. H19 TaxID=3452206 RepID=UPI003F89FFA3